MVFLVKSAGMVYEKTKEEVFSILEGTLMKKGKHADHFNEKEWWIRFLQQHLNLSLRCSDSLSLAQKKAVTK